MRKQWLAGMGLRKSKVNGRKNKRLCRRSLYELLEARHMLTGSGFPGNDCPPDLNLSAVAQQTVLAGQPLNFNLFTAGATVEDLTTGGTPTNDVLRLVLDPDIGTDTPTGASLTTPGAFSWTPTLAQVGLHTITVIAIDAGSPALADAETFVVRVLGENAAPNLAPIVDQTATIGEELVVNVSASDANNGDTLTFSLDPNNAPAGAVLQQTSNTTATIRWTPGPSDLPGPVNITVLVTDDGVLPLVDSESFSVALPVNNSPDLAEIVNQSATVGVQMVVNISATDADTADILTFTLDRDTVATPSDAILEQTSNTTAVIRWTPDLADVGAPVPFRVLVTDNGVPTKSDAEDFTVAVSGAEGFTLLAEGAAFSSSLTMPVALGQDVGTRKISFELETAFDGSSTAPAVEDLFQVYLVDSSDPTQTLLDNGKPGTAVFSLAGDQAEYQPGLVRFDGSRVEIDVTSLGSLSTANLVFQIINSDSDEGSKVAIGSIVNTTDTEALASPQLRLVSAPLEPGDAVALAGFAPAPQIDVSLQNVRYDEATGDYAAELIALNNGPAVGRNLAVVFAGLPSVVTFQNESGNDGAGNPYVNLTNAIGAGGLAAGASARPVNIRVANPGGVRFSLIATVLSGGANVAPTLAAIAPTTAVPGNYIEIVLDGSDANGDPLTYTLSSPLQLPGGMLTADGRLIFTPAPGDQGTYEFTVNLSDGVESVSRTASIVVENDPITTTRFSGRILGTNGQPLVGLELGIDSQSVFTDALGAFEFSFDGLPADLTLRVHGERLAGAESYPFVAEPLDLVLGHAIYENTKNVIARPIYLPPLDMDSATMVDPAAGGNVVNPNIPGLILSVPADALRDGNGNPLSAPVEFTVSTVPTELTPAALPGTLLPDLVLTIQPAGLNLTTPAPITFPNTANYPIGTLLDLWSINPLTGMFDKAGVMEVVSDGLSGTVIETVSGGIINSSWHFVAPPEPELMMPEELAQTEDPNCGCGGGNGKALVSGNSEVELFTGALRETHQLATYSALGQTYGLQLYYNSLHADPQPIVAFGFDNIPAVDDRYLVAELQVSRGDFNYQLPGFAGGMGFDGGEHFWTLPASGGEVTAGLQVDLAGMPTGVYDYTLRGGLYRQGTTGDFTGSSTETNGKLYVTNMIDSPFGGGWSLAGQQSIIENPDGSVMLMDGGGTRQVFELDPANAGQYLQPPADFSTLEKLVDGTYRRTMTDQTVYQFNDRNQLATMTDPNGRVTTWVYDTTGMLTKWTDPVGLETTFSYIGGKVASIVDPAGRTTTLEYDAAGNLMRITDPDGTFRTFGYDNRHRLSSEVDQRGFLEQSVYGADGRVESALLKDGSEKLVQSAQSALLSPATETSNPLTAPVAPTVIDAVGIYADANGSTEQVMLDRFGQLVSGVDAEGRQIRVSRSDNNLIQGTTDARGNPVVYDYDARGNVIAIADTVSDAGGAFTLDLIEQGDDAASQVVAALVRPGSGINVNSSSTTFVGAVGDGTDPDSAQSALYSGLILVASDPRMPTISNPDGVLLTSGSANIPRTNTNEAFDAVDPGTGSDPDLVTILESAGATSSEVNDVNSISFEFTVAPGITSVEADFVFASDEFPDQPVTDVFAFIIDGQNFAVFPDGSLVSFVEGANAENFNDNDFGTGNYRIEFDGISNSLHVVGLLDPTIPAGGTHTIKIAIANTSDSGFDSGVFIGNLVGGTATEAGSGIRTTSLRKQFTYDTVFSQVTSYTDELGRQTLYTIDPANGNRLAMREVVGAVDDGMNGESNDLVTTFTYTALGLVDKTTDPLGRLTDFDYDARGRLTKVTFAVGTPDEDFQSFEYDAAGNQTAVIDGNGNRTEFEYDSLNRLKKITEADPDGTGPLTSPITAFTYDARGNLTTTTDANGNVVTNQYDEMGRLARTIDSLQQATTFGYDIAGNLVTVTDPLGFTTSNIYDARNRLIETTDPEGGVTKFAYDTDDNLTSVIDPIGNQTLFRYDARNRLVQETDPLGATTVYAYDATDNLLRKTDRNGRVTEFAYDELNRVITETWLADDGTTALNTVAYAYDKASSLLSVVDAFSALAFTYDNRNRVNTVDNNGTPGAPNVVLDYGYDGVGNVTSVADTINSVAGATTSYAYDALNRTTTIQQSGNGVADKLVDFVYNELGQYSEIARYSDLTRTNLVARSQYSYDALNRLTSLEHGHASARDLAFYDFAYDPSSRITRISDVDGATDYAYDDRSHLTGADRNAADARGDESYAYDANGNRTNSHLHGYGYVTGPGNRLMSDSTYDYEYDGEGNMTKRTEVATGGYREFSWDHRNRLVRVTDFSSGGIITQKAEYSYDTLDRRTTKSVDGNGAAPGGEESTHFVYDREDVFLDFVDADGTGSVEVPVLDLRYLHGPEIDQVVAQENGNVQWLLTDHLGTVHDIVSNAGSILNHISYDSFGNVLAQSDSAFAARYHFTGREYDKETELFYYRARYYDAKIGRFSGEDPIGFGGIDWNVYRYVGGNPITRTDSNGMQFFSLIPRAFSSLYNGAEFAQNPNVDTFLNSTASTAGLFGAAFGNPQVAVGASAFLGGKFAGEFLAKLAFGNEVVGVEFLKALGFSEDVARDAVADFSGKPAVCKPD